MERIEERPRGIQPQIAPSRPSVGRKRVACKISPQREHVRRGEEGVRRHRLQQDRVPHGNGMESQALWNFRYLEPSLRVHREHALPLAGGVPAPAVKRGERDAPPPDLRRCGRQSGLHSHDHRGILLDLADLAKLDVVAEARHKGRLRTDSPEIPGGETRKEEKQEHADDRGAERDASRRKTQGPMKLPLKFRTRGEQGGHCAARRAPHLVTDKRGHAKPQKHKEEREEIRIHSKHGAR